MGTPSFDFDDSAVNQEVFAQWYETILNNILDNVDTSLVEGFYYGKEDPGAIYNNDNPQSVTSLYTTMLISSWISHDRGGYTVWSPYITPDTRPEYAADRTSLAMKNIGYVATTTYVDSKGVTQNLMDIILIQPGYYYSEIGGRTEEELLENLDEVYQSVLYQRVISYDKTTGTYKEEINPYSGNSGVSPFGPPRIGIQFEFDMGLFSGRYDGGKGTLPDDKRRRFAEYINRYYGLGLGAVDGNRKPFGMYAGGPNEMNLNNPYGKNTNVAGSNFKGGPYFVQGDESTNKKFKNLSYDEYNGYNGNVIYDIINGLVNNNWKPELLDFLNNR